MSDQRYDVAIVGVGTSHIGRRLERPLGLLAIDAVKAAVADAGLTLDDIDGVSTYPLYPVAGSAATRDGVTHVSTSWMVRNLGLRGIEWWSETEQGNISTAIDQAATALAQGRCDYAVVWRALHMPKQGSYQAAGIDRRDRVDGDRAFSVPYGWGGAVVGFAFAYMRYMKLYGARREHMAAVTTAFRRGANRNPRAIFHDVPLTVDDYLSARMISDPMCLLDCDIPIDGAGAIVLARADRARDLVHPPAYIAGVGQASLFGDRPVRTADVGASGPALFDKCRFNAATLGASLWRNSGLRPADIDGAMLYDGFSPDIYFWLEGLGFCGEGEAFEFVQNGRIELGGELPINTFGGNLSEGRLHGIGHWIEATLQIQRRAGSRQIADAQNILVATGMMAPGSGAVLTTAARPS